MSAAQKMGTATPPIAENKLFSRAHPTVTLLVEGGADEGFWRAHVHPACLVHVTGGRERALETLDKPSAAGCTLLACLDADLDRVTGTLKVRPDVFWTDAHDLELTLTLAPGLLEKLVCRVEKTRARWRDDLAQRLLAFVRPAGVLRWLRHIQKDPRVEALALHKTNDRGVVSGRFNKWGELIKGDDGLSPNAERFVKAVIDYNSAQRLLGQQKPLAEALRAGPEAEDDQLCNGHDLIGALCAWLTPKLNEEELTTRLMDCCEADQLQRTEMWRAMRRWQDEHPRFPLLRTRDVSPNAHAP